MSDIESKLEAIETRFRKGSKQYKAARYIVRQNRKITSEERKAMVQEIPIADKTLQGVFTKLRKMNLYPPQKTSGISTLPTPPEKPEETLHHVPEASAPPLQEYATLEDLNDLKDSLSKDIHYLAAVISGEAPSNPGNPVEYEEEMKLIQPQEIEVIQPQEMELIQPEEGFIQDPSLNRHSIWLKPKTSMYFDMSRQGIFSNYADSRELGPFTQFNGNLSDFFNIIVDDYFIRNYNADIGLLMRRYVK